MRVFRLRKSFVRRLISLAILSLLISLLAPFATIDPMSRTASAQVRQYELAIPASLSPDDWYFPDIGIIEEGDTLEIWVPAEDDGYDDDDSGNYWCWGGWPDCSDGNGTPGRPNSEELPVLFEGGQLGELYVAIGNQAYAAGNFLSIVAPVSGSLSFIMNDRLDHYFDNSGWLYVVVTITPGTPQPPPSPTVTSFTSNPSSPTANQSFTLTATSSTDMGPTPYFITIYDGSIQLADCGWGTNCTATVTKSAGNYTFQARISDSNGGNVQNSRNLSVSVGLSTPPPSPPQQQLAVLVTPLTRDYAYSYQGDTVLKISVTSNGSPVQYALVNRIEGPGSQTLLGETNSNGEFFTTIDPGRIPRIGTFSTEIFVYSPSLDASGTRILEYQVSEVPGKRRGFVLDNRGWVFTKLAIDMRGQLPDLSNGLGGPLDFLLPTTGIRLLESIGSFFNFLAQLVNLTDAKWGETYYPERGDSISQAVYEYQFTSGSSGVSRLFRFELMIERNGQQVYYASVFGQNLADLPPVMEPNFIAVSMASPATILLTDSAGRRTGLDPASGQVITEIPNSYYSGPDAEPQIIIVFGPQNEMFQVQVTGTGYGTIHLDYGGVASDGTGFGESIVTDVFPGEIITEELRYPPTGSPPPSNPPTSPEPPVSNNGAFERTWTRTDQPVASSAVSRTWMWGPEPNTDGMIEPYADSPNGERTVQYFDKSRMEITNPDAVDDGVWYVTNGLLVVELMTGRMQLGNNEFQQRDPAQINVAGDPGEATSPTYATFNGLQSWDARSEGELITQRVSRSGDVTDDTSLSGWDVRAARFVAETNHTVAAPFWDFMNSTGIVSENGQHINDALFQNPFYATGFPITEAYWARFTVAGTSLDILVQCFERRCLTYTPSNNEGWQVEAGNVGLHYYSWRYE